MLFGEHAGGERIGRIRIKNRDRRLGDNRAFIHGWHHEMHGAAMDFDAVGQGACMRVETAVGRQKRRVNIQKPPLPLADEPGCQHPHEARKADQLDAMQFEQKLHRTFEFLAAGINLVVDDGAGDFVVLGEGQSGRIWPVRQNKDDFGWVGGIARTLDQGPHVGATSGNQNSSALAPDLHSPSRPEKITRSPASNGTIWPSGIGSSPAAREVLAKPQRPCLQSAITTIPMPQLKVRSISLAAMPPFAASQLKTA